VDATGIGVWTQDLRTGEGFWSERMKELCGLEGPVDFEDFAEAVHPTNLLDRVLEPFFTTKGTEGTGLGLAASQAMMQHAGGWMTAESPPGSGARFELYFPIAEARLGASPRPVMEPRPSAGRVLVVDDQPMVRRVIQRSLERSGFEVVAVESVDEAGRLLSHDTDFVAALVDRSMPDAPGSALVPILRQAVPDARVAFLTGDGVPEQERALVDGVVYKPVTVTELNAAVRALIDQ
jgi:CheY-like chemotaxis protein